MQYTTAVHALLLEGYVLNNSISASLVPIPAPPPNTLFVPVQVALTDISPNVPEVEVVAVICS